MYWFMKNGGPMANLSLAQRIVYDGEINGVVAYFPDDGEGSNDEFGNSFVLLNDCTPKEGQEFMVHLMKKMQGYTNGE